MKAEKIKQAQEAVNDALEDLMGMSYGRERDALTQATARLFEGCAWLSVAADMATKDEHGSQN